MRLPAGSGWVEVQELSPTAQLRATPRFPEAGTGTDPLQCGSQLCHGPYPHPAQGDASALSCLAGMLGCTEPVGGTARHAFPPVHIPHVG